ncbi:hypothetical protein JCM8547_009018 [Rhodosporidiobolus lusitaniae]
MVRLTAVAVLVAAGSALAAAPAPTDAPLPSLSSVGPTPPQANLAASKNTSSACASDGSIAYNATQNVANGGKSAGDYCNSTILELMQT